MDFQAVRRLLNEGVVPDRAQIIRGKRLVIESLTEGALRISELERRYWSSEAVQPSADHLQLADMSESDVARLLGRGHPLLPGFALA